MKPFVEIRGHIVALAAITEIQPPSHGIGYIRLVTGQPIQISDEEFLRIKAALSSETTQL